MYTGDFWLNIGLWAPRGLPSKNPLLPDPARDSAPPCSPVCWGSVIFPRWVTWTGDVLGTPSQPGSLAPQNCSERHQGREDAFSLWIGLSPCLPNGECQTCGLWKVTRKQPGLIVRLTPAGDSTPGWGPRHCELIVSLRNQDWILTARRMGTNRLWEVTSSGKQGSCGISAQRHLASRPCCLPCEGLMGR